MGKKRRSNLHKKLFRTYMAILVLVVTVLTSLFLLVMRNKAIETEMNYLEKMHREAVRIVARDQEITAAIHQDLYRSNSELNDILRYLTCSEEEYLKKNLDFYAQSSELLYEDMKTFLKSTFETYSEIQSIELVSARDMELSVFYRDGKTRPYLDGRRRINWIRSGRLGGTGDLTFVREMHSEADLSLLGYLLIHFSGKELQEISDIGQNADLIVHGGHGIWVTGAEFVKDQPGFLLAEKAGNLEEKYDVHAKIDNVGPYTIVSTLDQRVAARIPLMTILLVVGLAAVTIVLGCSLIHKYLIRLDSRLQTITAGMQKVMVGDLSVRLPLDHNRDELDVISESFNVMCEKLDQYIQKSYLLEIEQRNAEMQALQSQINPHFLYNTLEAIRMKAICNGDREVGKMLYSMAVTFRSQIKEKDVITLMQEMHYCKKYLELFEIRHFGKFTSTVECPPELADVPIIKFVLQPLIENYFLHGIKNDSTDNFIHIYVEDAGEKVCVHLEDNGFGMTAAEIEAKNRELKENKTSEKGSIGLANVNRRIHAVYGPEYGVHLQARPEGGLHIILSFCKTGGTT